MNTAAIRACPVCGATSATTIGPVLHPRPVLVAGVVMDLGDTEYRLRRCQQCGFQFKDPPYDPERLMECYSAAAQGNWETDPNPSERRFDLLREVVKRHARGTRVLDVGCFTGALLKYLGDGWQIFGVEPSRDAAEMARHRGVQILAKDLDSLDPNVGLFDVILVIDVVEHLVEPMPFFKRLSDLLSRGGILVILTGNTDSMAWRLQRGAYWYSSLPEHVSFYNRESLDWIGARFGLTTLEHLRVRHKRQPTMLWCLHALKSTGYVVGRSVAGLGVPVLRRWCVERRGPTISTARDHLIYVFGKP